MPIQAIRYFDPKINVVFFYHKRASPVTQGVIVESKSTRKSVINKLETRTRNRDID